MGFVELKKIMYVKQIVKYPAHNKHSINISHWDNDEEVGAEKN